MSSSSEIYSGAIYSGEYSDERKISLARDAEMGTNEQLEKRVRDLETTRTIVIALAVIFGISGGWGAYRLNQINGALDKAEERVKGLEHDAGAATAIQAAHTQRNQVKEQQSETTIAQTAKISRIPPGQSIRNSKATAVRPPVADEKPFEAAVERFRESKPPDPYVTAGYRSDLKGLSDLLLGYLGYMQAGNRVDKSTSEKFFGQALLAAADVKSRSSQKIPSNDPFFEWHTRTSLDNFISIVGKMKEDQESTQDNTLSASQITYYEIDIPHWRDGVFGFSLT